MKQLRGPQLPVARDEVGNVAGGGTREPDSVKDAFEIVAVTVETGEIEPRRLGAQHDLGNGGVSCAEPGELRAVALVLRFGELDELEKSVCHTAASRKDDALRTRRLGLDDV